MLDAARPAGAPIAAERASFSQLLADLLAASDTPDIALGELIDGLRDRAFGAVLLVFAAPNMLPVTLPGTSLLTSLPIMLVSIQLLLGWHELHVPARLAHRRLPRAGLLAVVVRLRPWLQRAERITRPRLGLLVSPPAERLVGAVCLVLGVVLFFPIPLGNIPPGVSIAILSLGLMERDGRMIAIGLAAAVLSVVIVLAILAGAWGLGTVALRAAIGG